MHVYNYMGSTEVLEVVWQVQNNYSLKQNFSDNRKNISTFSRG